MAIIRPVAQEDLDQLVELAGQTGFGLTSLPKDHDLLAKRIAHARRTFSMPPDQPGGELYLFVMEDRDAGRVVGTSCIVSKVGGFQPFYAYSIQSSIHESEMLKIRKSVQTLHLVAEHSGPTEIGGLWLAPDYRKHGNGRLLSLFRFLYMAEHPERFEPVIIAEMRGVVDHEGHSPFWEALGRHFFDMEFPKADYLSVKDKRFIADLMPTCPIYVPLLHPEAQKVIGKVHENTQPALRMLQREGFKYSGMVDIFEAGPIISCRLDDIRVVKESRIVTVDEITDNQVESIPYIITNMRDDFRACMGSVVSTSEGGVRITARTAEGLKVIIGNRIRFGPLRPTEPHGENQ